MGGMGGGMGGMGGGMGGMGGMMGGGMGGMGMGMGGGMGGMGGGMGGMGGGMGGMGGGMGGMGGGMGGMGGGAAALARPVQLEIEGGRRLNGKIGLGFLAVESELGQYWIRSDRIKTIRFATPEKEAKPEAKEDEQPGDVAGPGARPGNVAYPSTILEGKVVTTSGQEIDGGIHVPNSFVLQLEFGSLRLDPDQLRTITFTGAKADAGTERKEGPAKPTAGGAAARAHDQIGRLEPDEPEGPPTYFRHGKGLIVSVPGDNRVAFHDLETGTSQAIELSGSKDAPVSVMWIGGSDAVMPLTLSGPRITRLAIADLATGRLQPQDLREPVEGGASPLVGPGLVVYALGRYVYAYSAQAHRWDVAELPEALTPQQTPVLGPDGTTVASRGHVYAFVVKTGKWEHIDVRKVLGTGEADRKP
jgi:hypothetical protein